MSTDLSAAANQKRVQGYAAELITAWRQKGKPEAQRPTMSTLKDYVEFMICNGESVEEEEVWITLTRDQRLFFYPGDSEEKGTTTTSDTDKKKHDAYDAAALYGDEILGSKRMTETALSTSPSATKERQCEPPGFMLLCHVASRHLTAAEKHSRVDMFYDTQTASKEACWAKTTEGGIALVAADSSEWAVVSATLQSENHPGAKDRLKFSFELAPTG